MRIASARGVPADPGQAAESASEVGGDKSAQMQGWMGAENDIWTGQKQGMRPARAEPASVVAPCGPAARTAATMHAQKGGAKIAGWKIVAMDCSQELCIILLH